MRYEELIGLRTCPFCGAAAHIRRNASKRFQVHCKKCDCQTAWTSKPAAIVAWYNNADFYERTHGKAKPEETKRNVRNELTEAGKMLLKYASDMERGALIDISDITSIAENLKSITQKE